MFNYTYKISLQLVFFVVILFTISCVTHKPTEPYSRKDWGGWRVQKCLDTRAQILKAQSLRPVRMDSKSCKVTEGLWVDFYTGDKITMKDQPQIDHVVPVKHAHSMGGAQWTKIEKSRFYNDKENLVVTSRSMNASKGALSFVEWHPMNRKLTCLYAAKWIHVKNKYGLKYSKPECLNIKVLEEKAPCPQPLAKPRGC